MIDRKGHTYTPGNFVPTLPSASQADYLWKPAIT